VSNQQQSEQSDEATVLTIGAKVIVHSELVQRATLMICVAALCYTELVVVHRTPSTRDSQRCSACFVWWCTFERGVDFHLHSQQLLQPLREFIHRLCAHLSVYAVGCQAVNLVAKPEQIGSILLCDNGKILECSTAALYCCNQVKCSTLPIVLP